MVNNAPLHGKKTFVFLQQTGISGLDLVSYATDFSIAFTPRAVAYAHVLGTDAVPGVEAHGYAARGRVTLLLSTDMPHWLAALDNRSTVLGDVEADYDQAATNFSTEKGYHVASKLDMMVAILDSATPLDAENVILNLVNLRKKVGYIWELNRAAIVALEPSGRVGEYVSVRLEVETGHWTGYSNSTLDV